ncbi:hypothetical protein [Legionella londiniensis]|uniref:hypothetical protein n=1 Tax=Legionella londiniensis TaxID=45068 RepID=UPI000730D0FD|nr:hypothetical protein [Legionella londiniensis]
MKNSDLGEQIMAQAYMTREPRIIAELYAKFPNIYLIGSVNKIAATFNSQIQEDVKKWLCQEIIKNELNKGLGANANTILTALQYGVDFYQPFGSLHLGEQIMAQACMAREPRIIAELYAKFPNIHLIGAVNKIAATFYPQTQEDVKKWLYQEIIKNEFNKGHSANINTILTALYEGVSFSYPYRKGLCFGEQVAIQAFISKESRLIAGLYACHPKINYVILVERVASIFDKQIQPEVKRWLYSEVIKNEFNKGPNANVYMVLAALQQGFDFYQIYDSRLTLGEQAMAQAFMAKEPKIIAEICRKYPNIDYITAVERVTNTFDKTCRLDVNIWLSQEVFKNRNSQDKALSEIKFGRFFTDSTLKSQDHKKREEDDESNQLSSNQPQ